MWLFMNKIPIITLREIEKKYQLGSLESIVLKSVTLDVFAGEMLAIVGASGSGKSTLMNLIGLLDKPDQGDYWLKGKNTRGIHEDDCAILRNQHIGFVFQQFNLLSRFTALQNVALPLTYRELPASLIQQGAMDALARVGMNAFASHRPTQLSGGQQQRVAIARALVTEPQVILADEPTGALDSVTGQDIMNLFLALNKEGRTVIIVTHDEQVAHQCSRRITIADGRIIHDEAVTDHGSVI
jgi:putative ABC transport system ATP-binding protein